MNVLITGAANGLGYAAAKYFSLNEHNVYSIDIIKPEDIDRIKGFKVDVTNINEIKIFKKYLEENNIYFDIIINFAGIYDIGSFIEKDLNKIHKLINVNLLGPINVNQILFTRLNDKGKIIIITSELANLDPLPFNGIYNVSKTALDCYAQSLRQELNLLGKKVITIRPGAFNTNLSKGSLEQTKKLMDETTIYKKQSKNFYKIVKTFMGKPKDPNILAKLIYKISLKKNPKFIYKKHTNKGLWLLNILPKRLQCFVVKQLLK